MTEKKQSNAFRNIVIVLLTFLSVYFIVSIKSNTNTYREEINLLELKIDSLNQVLSSRVPRDSIIYYLSEQEISNNQISSLNRDIENLKKRYNERKVIDFSTLSTDSNIVILARFISEENITRR